jgi:hypothetical protein
MACRLARILSVVLAAATLGVLCPALSPPAARADGDPASDVLLGEDVFFPYAPQVTAALQHTLNAETAAARKAHAPIKVALIDSPVDLGVIPDLFDKPQQYADFLDQEISFQSKQPLLVVMPAGYGTQGLPAQAASAIAALPKPAGKQSNDLARAAVVAIARLAAAEGHPITGVHGAPSSASSGGGSNSTILVILLAAALVTATALVVITVRRRQTTT